MKTIRTGWPGLALSCASAALLMTMTAPSASAQAAQTPPPQAQAPAVAPKADLPAARAIIDRHLELTGGRKAIQAHSSSHMTGTLEMPANGISGTIEVFAAKPNLMLTKITLGGLGEISEGNNGTVAWSLSPMTGPMLSQGKELEQKMFDSDFYGELRDAARYKEIRTVEKTDFDGRPCYKVSLVKKDGTEDFEYYDVATGLKAGASASRDMPMGTVTSQQTFSDYKKFGDLLQPTTVRISAMGVEQIVKVTSVEYDKVAPAVFEPPAAIKALIK